MTTTEIASVWDAALRRAEADVDERYSATTLERFFFLQRTVALMAPSACVNSLAATAFFHSEGFRPWSTDALAAHCSNIFHVHDHADPPTGDGLPLHWLCENIRSHARKEVYSRLGTLFGPAIRPYLESEGETMPKNWLTDTELEGAYFKADPGRHTLKIKGEPKETSGKFGGYDIPTDKGIFTSGSAQIFGPLKEYAKRHRSKIIGAILTFTVTMNEDDQKRYTNVTVR